LSTATATVNEALVLRPPTRRMTGHHRVNPYPGAHRENETENTLVCVCWRWQQWQLWGWRWI